MENKSSELLNKKISIGLSLSMSLDEYKKILEKYREYLHSIYFSPPIDGKFHSRAEITEQFKDIENVKKFYKIIELMRDNDILLDCVINRPSISSDDVLSSIDCIKGLNVDQITCLNRHIDVIDEYFPNKQKIFSYNNDFHIKDLKHITNKFSTIVVGKYLLRNPDMLKEIYDKGFNLKLLVNNGCSFNCKGCKNGNRQCQSTFLDNLENNSLNYLFALQSFYPFELHELLSSIDIPIESIKISNRTDGYTYLDKCLESYIYNIDTDKYLEDGLKNYRLWSRLAAFYPYFNELDNKEIKCIKTKSLRSDKDV